MERKQKYCVILHPKHVYYVQVHKIKTAILFTTLARGSFILPAFARYLYFYGFVYWDIVVPTILLAQQFPSSCEYIFMYHFD